MNYQRSQCKTQNSKIPKKNNTGVNLDDFEYRNYFLRYNPKVQSMKEVISKLDFIKIKKFCL